MSGMVRLWACVALVLVSDPAVAMSGRSVEVPINEAGDVPVADIVAGLARASGVAIDRPPAGMTLSTRGSLAP